MSNTGVWSILRNDTNNSMTTLAGGTVARTFNAAIPAIVQSKVNAGRHVHLVDLH